MPRQFWFLVLLVVAAVHGSARAEEFLLDTTIVYAPSVGGQSKPAMAFDGTNFLAVWQDHRSVTTYDVYGARLRPDGTVLAEITAGPGLDSEVQLWPDSSSWWTGFVQHDRLANTYGRSDNLIKLEYLYTMNIEDKVRSGWMKFNTASIPDGSTIHSASLRYLVSYFEMTVELQVTALSRDPVTAQSEVLFAAIEEGAECAYRDIGRVFDTTDLNSTGSMHVQNTLGQNWVAFGLRGGNFRGILSRKAWILGWNTTPPRDRPQLFVSYSPPQAVAEREMRQAPDREPLATVARGTLRLPSSRLPEAYALLSPAGRKAMDLHPGPNDISRLAPGVYFARPTSGASPETPRILKVVLTR